MTTSSHARLDYLLRFSADIEAAYETQTRQRRVAELRRSIIFGLCTYNLYNFTSIYLMPDILWFSVFVRVGVITPVSILLLWMIGRVGATCREWLMTIGVTNAFASPVLLFLVSDAPLSAFTFGEFPLTLVFGNMLLLLRFRHAILFTGTSLALASTAAMLKAGIDTSLSIAFVIQIATGSIFSLHANWRAETNRCRAFLRELDVLTEAEAATAASRKFQDLSLTDALTGLPNRRALDNELAARFGQDQSITILMIDIDHFKNFNDQFGHPAGDDCLRRIAACLRDISRRFGVSVARFGGEEFTVFAGQQSEHEAVRLAHRVVEDIRALKIPHPGRADGLDVVTASVGFARIDQTRTATPEAMLGAADHALYLAKKRGRNGWASFNRDQQPATLHA
ncbi:diguanylate cyclase [Bradyrhizobium sp. HKCCYLS20291]|uniref:GGDEF domain-containing protein n=1 Tax=Bradyrhizobium sp. HKCCYLS20291 TaxID=3420766 RepID=UPI003EBDD47A